MQQPLPKVSSMEKSRLYTWCSTRWVRTSARLRNYLGVEIFQEVVCGTNQKNNKLVLDNLGWCYIQPELNTRRIVDGDGSVKESRWQYVSSQQSCSTLQESEAALTFVRWEARRLLTELGGRSIASGKRGAWWNPPTWISVSLQCLSPGQGSSGSWHGWWRFAQLYGCLTFCLPTFCFGLRSCRFRTVPSWI